MPVGGSQRRPAQQQASCFKRMQMGFLMGIGVGSAAGVIFSLFGVPTLIKAGFTPAKIAMQSAKTVGATGFSFGTFMSIGTGIRC